MALPPSQNLTLQNPPKIILSIVNIEYLIVPDMNHLILEMRNGSRILIGWNFILKIPVLTVLSYIHHVTLFFRAGDGSQDLPPARQVLYHWMHPQALIFKILRKCIDWTNLKIPWQIGDSSSVATLWFNEISVKYRGKCLSFLHRDLDVICRIRELFLSSVFMGTGDGAQSKHFIS